MPRMTAKPSSYRRQTAETEDRTLLPRCISCAKFRFPSSHREGRLSRKVTNTDPRHAETPSSQTYADSDPPSPVCCLLPSSLSMRARTVDHRLAELPRMTAETIFTQETNQGNRGLDSVTSVYLLFKVEVPVIAPNRIHRSGLGVTIRGPRAK